ncbi:Fic family protein [Candidatus Woesearchaeota archaeon]|nr:Fic family protein [Candidatus Woesearchaeota archaeon]
MSNIDPRIGYRTLDVRVFRVRFETTPAPYVKTDMGILLDFYRSNLGRIHPLTLATIFYHKFEKIHPFADGNGRTGRMLLNLILLRARYPPAIIFRRILLEQLPLDIQETLK